MNMDEPPMGAMEAILQRRSINFFDPTETISPDVIETLLVGLPPASMPPRLPVDPIATIL